MATGNIKVSRIRTHAFTTVPSTVTTEKEMCENVITQAYNLLHLETVNTTLIGSVVWAGHAGYTVEATSLGNSTVYVMIRSYSSKLYIGYANDTILSVAYYLGTLL